MRQYEHEVVHGIHFNQVLLIKNARCGSKYIWIFNNLGLLLYSVYMRTPWRFWKGSHVILGKETARINLSWFNWAFQCSMKDGTGACNGLKPHILKFKYTHSSCKLYQKSQIQAYFQDLCTKRLLCNIAYCITNTVVISRFESSGGLYSVKALGRDSGRETFTLKWLIIPSSVLPRTRLSSLSF